jgi:DNA helicase HerA-like ATPase
MILDDKKRVIGKIVSINSDRFTIELLSGTKNFNINGYDDIHYFAQINSYVIVPYQNDYIVAEVVSVREKDTTEFSNAKEQELSKVYSVKNLEVLPVGIITDRKFTFGVSGYPTLYSDVLYIKDEELDSIFEVQDQSVPVCKECDNKDSKCSEHNDSEKGKKRLTALGVGKSAIFQDYDIKINIDKFFGSHSAVLGNTGSGKSCTISSMLQTLFKESDYSAVGATFMVFDVNGEYKNAFKDLEANNSEISVKELEIKESGTGGFKLPHHFFNLDEWELLLQAAEKTQRPVLRSALALASLFSKNEEGMIKEAKNHILATCISEIMRDETSSPSTRDRILSILRKFNTDDIKLDKAFTYEDEDRNTKSDISYDQRQPAKNCTIANCLFVHFGGMIGSDQLHDYLESTDDHGKQIFFKDNFQMPTYDKNSNFDFQDLESALDIAILYEEAHGNRHIRDYCSSLLTRYKSIKERSDFTFIKDKGLVDKHTYILDLLGIEKKKKTKQVIILNLDSLDDELVEIVSSVLSRLVFDFLKDLPQRNVFPVNLVLEEAHRYVSDNLQRNFIRSNQIFERIAKEGRKYGLFFLISSQRPSELSKTVLSQCNNFIVHRIQNPEDLSHIRQITPHISEATLKKLPSIPTQHALLFGSAVNIPTLFKVNDADPRPLSDNNAISENWFINKNQAIAVIK